MPTGPAPIDVFHQERLSTGPPLRIVGIGASAGAVEAFTRLLKALPADTGMAFVLVSHLSPTHQSELARLFTPLTVMPVHDAIDGMAPEPNQVYILPPDRILTIKDGRLRLAARDAGEVVPTAIDQFLESLAVDLGPLAVGVILTGTGSDGTAGIQAIRNHGGVTYAQDPTLAASPGMPRSAVESGSVDFVLSLEGLASALTGHPRPPQAPSGPAAPTLVLHSTENGVDPSGASRPLSEHESAEVQGIIKFLQTGTGVDFQHYKLASLVRRIRRRAETIGLPDLADYLVRLRQDPAELSELYQVVLIKVTRFFREPEVFETLETTVIPALRLSHTGEPVRAWVVGCSSGEEAYSLAISFLEVEAILGAEIPVRVFASDVSDPALAAARLGHYAADIAANVSAERLERFFAPVDGGYQVSRQLREMCVFARHDITRDPPFPQLDLVLCCNVLIYLDPVLQRRLLQNIHYALKPGGYLVLGPAETAVGVEGLFSVFDRKHQVYLRRVGPARLQGTREGFLAKPLQAPIDAAPTKLPRTHWSPSEVQRAAERAMFLHYPTASVIVNQEFEVLHYQGVTAPYLQAPTGGPTAKLLRLAHPDLRLVLGRILRRVKKDGQPMRRAGVSLGEKPPQQVNLAVVPVPLDDSDERYYLIVFDPVPEALRVAAPAKRAGAQVSSRVVELEIELAESKEYLQVFIDQQDTANAEVQAAYEASLSVNEEYQSTNEELESAKEELQSLNEELTTMNEQMQQRNTELQARSAEVSGLLEALDMPLLLLTRDLRLRAYNSRAAADFHLTPAKVGLTLGESMLPMLQGDLRELVERAFGVGEVQELELQDQLGRWRALRIWPIQPDGDGGTAAIAFVDIHKLKADIAEERDARSYSEAVVETILDPLVVLDESARMLHANRAFHRTFGIDTRTLEPRSIAELGGEDWDPALITDFLTRAAQADRPLDGPEVQLTSSRIGRRTFQLGAGTISWRGPRRILLALKDVTERKLAEEAALETSRMQAVGQLAGGVAHEINNQMTVVIGLASFLLKETAEGSPRRSDIQHILKAADRSASISQQLLAFSRRQMLQPVLFDLNAMVSMAETNLRPFLRPDIVLEVVLGERVGQIKADLAQMEQLLVNLAINARDAMEGPGRLRIETTMVKVTDAVAGDPDTPVMPRGNYARLIVTDTGHGMDPATTARIFEPFFTTKGVGQGTGLGLASVYGVVKQSGGSIWVDSTLGRGTTFTIDLPQVVAPSQPAMTSAEPSSVQGGSETIMVVDDQELVRVWVARSLRELGYTAVEASDGFHALSLIAEGQAVSLVVSDVSMPGMDGNQLRNHLAELCPEVPVLFMSGFALDDLVHRGRLDAGTHLLHKPFSSEALGAKVREAINSAAKV